MPASCSARNAKGTSVFAPMYRSNCSCPSCATTAAKTPRAAWNRTGMPARVKAGTGTVGTWAANQRTTSCPTHDAAAPYGAPRIASSRHAYVSYVGVPHGVQLDGQNLFFRHVHLHGGPAPVRRYLPKLIELITERKIDPGKVFDLTLPLDQVAEGYRAMDERRAIKTLLRV